MAALRFSRPSHPPPRLTAGLVGSLALVLSTAAGVAFLPGSDGTFLGTTTSNHSVGTGTIANASGLSASRPCGTPSAPTLRDVTTASSSDADVTITAPTTQRNDLLLAAINTYSTSSTIGAPTGWTKVGNTTQGPNNQLAIFWTIAPSSPASSYTFTWNSGAGTAILASYSGADTQNPITSSGYDKGWSTTISAPSVTAPRAPARLVMVAADSPRYSMGTPSGMSRRADADTGTFGVNGQTLWDELRTVAGATGKRESSITLTNYIAWALLISAPYADPTVALSWTPPTQTAVTGYQLQRTGGTGETFTLSGRTTSTATDRYTTPGTALTYTLTSTTGIGWSSSGAVATAAACPT